MADHQRTIRIADFELPRGPVTIEALIAMPRASWEHLRSQINIRRQSDSSVPLARCRLCEAGAFIRSQATIHDHVPMFVHFPEGSQDCPLCEGRTLRPDEYRAALQAKGIRPCIPPRKGRILPASFDKNLYRQRHKVENMFGKLKDWRRIHTRYDRCAHTFLSAIAAIFIFWIN